MSNVSWQIKIYKKFCANESGEAEYVKPVWSEESWWADSPHSRRHFVHVSTEDSSQIAYTMDYNHGERGRTTRTRPGRYLTKYFSGVLPVSAIAAYASEHTRQHSAMEGHSLHFAHTREEIRKAYIPSLGSCMSYEYDRGRNGSTGTRFGNLPCQPPEVYGAGDLAVAYCTVGGRITGRTLVHPETKSHIRMYGDEVVLGSLLEKAGYADNGHSPFLGSKMLKIPYQDTFICPYLDLNLSVDVKGDHLLLVDYGDYESKNTDGLLAAGHTCGGCAERLSEDDMFSAPDGEDVCENCFYNNYFRCNHCDETGYNDDRHTLADSELCESCFSEIAFHCSDCGEAYHETEGCSTKNGMICSDCRDRYYVVCDDCEEAVKDSTRVGDSDYCDDCLPDHGEVCAICEEYAETEDVRDHEGNRLCPGCFDSETEDDDDESDAPSAQLTLSNTGGR